VTQAMFDFLGLSDPRKKSSECKIRRSSADSGNTNLVCSSLMHSTTGSSSSSFSSIVQLQASTTASVTSGDGNESDDNRPGTPLCDENPECFTSSDNAAIAIDDDDNKPEPKTQSPPSLGFSARTDPISLPLPEFGLNRPKGSSNSSSSSKEFPSSSVRFGRNSVDLNPQSPLKSPSTGSLLASSSIEADDAISEVIPYPIKNTCTTWGDGSVDTAADTNTAMTVEDVSFPSAVKSESVKPDGVKPFIQHVDGIAPSDSESVSSPSSPSSATLEQRIQKCVEKYDRWNGNRANLSSSQPLLVSSNSLSGLGVAGESGIGFDKSESEIAAEREIDAEITNKLMKKFLNFEDLKNQPSDIGRSLLAKRSVFDEDTKRLENFEEKYNPKACGIPGAVSSSNWRALALQRSSSTASNSSTSSASGWQTPSTPTTPLTPLANGYIPMSPGFPLGPPYSATVSRLFHQQIASSSPVAGQSLSSSSSSASGCIANSNPAAPNYKPSIPPNVFQNNSSSQLLMKDKDLISNQIQGLPTAPKITSDPKFQLSLNTPPTCTPTDNSVNIVQPSLGSTSTKKPFASECSKSAIAPNSKPTQPENSESPMKIPIVPMQAPVVVEQSTTLLSTSSLLSSSVGSSVSPGTQPMVHQGLPRAVERSLSLDSKKALSSGNGSSWNNIGASVQQSGAGTSLLNNGASSKIPPSSSIGLSHGNSMVSRRSSVDCHSSKYPVNKTISDNGADLVTGVSEKKCDPSSVLNKKVKEVKDDGNIIKYPLEKVASPFTPNNHIKSERISSKQSQDVDSPVNSRKDVTIRKSDVDFIKQEVMEMRPIHQETTVAVVASDSIPFIPSRTDSHTTPSSREASTKKDKERKTRTSGSSTPVSSSTAPSSALVNPTTRLDSTSSGQQSSSRDRLSSSSSRGADDKKEKKDKSVCNEDSTVVVVDDNQNVDSVGVAVSPSTQASKKLDEKRDKRERKETKDRDLSDHSSHKKDGSSKRKRRPSSQEDDSQSQGEIFALIHYSFVLDISFSSAQQFCFICYFFS
jgi:hypothetical protein